MPTQTSPASPRYVWQHPAWPQLTFDSAALAPALDQARLGQGRLLGLLSVEGVGKATRYAVNVPGWEQPAVKD